MEKEEFSNEECVKGGGGDRNGGGSDAGEGRCEGRCDDSIGKYCVDTGGKDGTFAKVEEGKKGLKGAEYTGKVCGEGYDEVCDKLYDG